MHQKSLAINEKLGRQEGMASEYGNLGVVYQTRGELDRAEEMLKKSLAIDEKLGRQEGMARQYGNLGLIYQTRGELDRAEEMHKKSLAIDEKLGRQEGMATSTATSALLQQRGDLDERGRFGPRLATCMPRSGCRTVEMVQGWLDGLPPG